MIPKIIHYAWFGNGTMPKIERDCIETWKKAMPDWEFKMWDESNFDVDESAWVRNFYDLKKYGHMSNVVRLKALQEFGGVWIDADVEVFKSFDPLLDCDFFVFQTTEDIDERFYGVHESVIGAVPNHPSIKRMLSRYRKRHTESLFLNTVMREELKCNVGVVFEDGKYVKVNNMAFYPVEYFSGGNCPKALNTVYPNDKLSLLGKPNSPDHYAHHHFHGACTYAGSTRDLAC